MHQLKCSFFEPSHFYLKGQLRNCANRPWRGNDEIRSWSLGGGKPRKSNQASCNLFHSCDHRESRDLFEISDSSDSGDSVCEKIMFGDRSTISASKVIWGSSDSNQFFIFVYLSAV